jgi:1-acyl-sn-glycerol-3-phosphate acyltransferase
MFRKALGAPDERVRELTRRWAIGFGERFDIEVRAHDLTRAAIDGPCVVMANHQSYLDVFALLRILPNIVGFVAKQQLFNVPLFGGVMRAIGCVGVDRNKKVKAITAMRETATAVRDGRPIAIFPEGTRSPGDRILPLKKGPFYLAQLARVPIVPIGIRGSAKLMPRSNTSLRSGVIDVHVGEPILPPAKGEPRTDAMAKVRKELSLLADLPMRD